MVKNEYNYTVSKPPDSNYIDSAKKAVMASTDINSKFLNLLANDYVNDSDTVVDALDTVRANIAYTNGTIGELDDNTKNTVDTIRVMSNAAVNQSVMNRVLQDQLINAENEYNILKENNVNKLRMVELNTYYIEKYKNYIDLMKLIILFSVPLLLITILLNKNILPYNIALILGGTILVVGLYMIITRIIDLSKRDNMNFNEYNLRDISGIAVGSENQTKNTIPYDISNWLKQEANTFGDDIEGINSKNQNCSNFNENTSSPCCWAAQDVSDGNAIFGWVPYDDLNIDKIPPNLTKSIKKNGYCFNINKNDTCNYLSKKGKNNLEGIYNCN